MFALKHPGVRFGPKNSSLMTLEGEIVYNFVVAQPSLHPSLGVQMIKKTCWTKLTRSPSPSAWKTSTGDSFRLTPASYLFKFILFTISGQKQSGGWAQSAGNPIQKQYLSNLISKLFGRKTNKLNNSNYLNRETELIVAIACYLVNRWLEIFKSLNHARWQRTSCVLNNIMKHHPLSPSHSTCTVCVLLIFPVDYF